MRSDAEALVEAHLWLVRKIAGRWRLDHRHDDITAAGNLGLCQAAKAYRPGGVPFRSFAWSRIEGAIRDYLRGEDHLTRTERAAIGPGGAEPRKRPMWLDDPALAVEKWLPDRSAPDPFDVTSARERAAFARRALERLDARRLGVVRQYHWQEMTLSAIGGTLGVTEARVCQILGEAHAVVRKVLSLQGVAA